MSAQAIVAPRPVRPLASPQREHALQAHANVIDRIPKPIFVIGLDRQIYACNRAGKAMLAQSLSPMRATQGCLYGVDTTVDNAIAFQTFAVMQWPDLVFADQYAPIAAPMRTQWIAVSVSCLQMASDEASAASAPCLLLTVHPVLTCCNIDPALLQAALGLSRSEARVSALIYAGLSLREVALRMEIRQSTAKTHLQGVFTKTRIGKQTELVKLVASLA